MDRCILVAEPKTGRSQVELLGRASGGSRDDVVLRVQLLPDARVEYLKPDDPYGNGTTAADFVALHARVWVRTLTGCALAQRFFELERVRPDA